MNVTNKVIEKILSPWEVRNLVFKIHLISLKSNNLIKPLNPFNLMFFADIFQMYLIYL
jgi:hypothetical protein